LTGAACGAAPAAAAAWPDARPRGGFGPRGQATVAWRAGRLGSSQRDVAALRGVLSPLDPRLGVLSPLDPRLGSVAALEQQVSAAVAAPVAEARTFVRPQSAVNADETGWREGRRPLWLGTAITPLVTVFLVLATRGRRGAPTPRGAACAGSVGPDRRGGSTCVAPPRRHACWAHLRRDCAAFVARGAAPARRGQALLDSPSRGVGGQHAQY